jgi:DNA-binding transcriptional regulator GbsR (MarR family)
MTTTNLEKRSLEEQQYIQDVGILFEEFNLPRIAGRILGYLLICDPPYQTAGELLTATGGSKGSISSMTKLLIHTGSIERTSVIGKRGTYYRIKSGSLTDLLTMRMFFLKSMRQLAEKGLNIIGDTSTLQYKRLKEIRDLYAFFENEWPALLERWEKKRRK